MRRITGSSRRPALPSLSTHGDQERSGEVLAPDLRILANCSYTSTPSIEMPGRKRTRAVFKYEDFVQWKDHNGKHRVGIVVDTKRKDGHQAAVVVGRCVNDQMWHSVCCLPHSCVHFDKLDYVDDQLYRKIRNGSPFEPFANWAANRKDAYEAGTTRPTWDARGVHWDCSASCVTPRDS